MYKICYIYLRDSEYATQFVTYFRQKLPKQVEIKMISERQEPMEISEAAIVISDDRQFLEEFSREGIYLSSQPVTDKENEIFMYQKRERIWQNFCEITKMEQEIEGKRRKKGKQKNRFSRLRILMEKYLSLRRWRIIKIYWILVFRRLKA